jgi:hypothetical protein
MEHIFLTLYIYMAANSSQYDRFARAIDDRKPAAVLRAMIEEANSVNHRWLFSVLSNYTMMDYIRNPPIARELVLTLLDKGLPIDVLGEPVILNDVSKWLNRPLLDGLLERGLDVNIQNKRDGTPLITYVLKELIGSEYGFLSQIAEGENETDTYTQFINQRVIDLIDVFHRLVQQGVELSSADKRGVTPLFRVIAGPYTPRTNPIIQAVLEESDINRQNSSGQTPLMALAQTPAHELRYGEKSPVQIAQFLLDHGADPTIRDNKGHTAADFIDIMVMMNYNNGDNMEIEGNRENRQDMRRMTELADFLREQEKQGPKEGGRRGRGGRKTRKGRKGRRVHKTRTGRKTQGGKKTRK